MSMNLWKRLHFYLKGGRICVPNTIFIEFEYDEVGDAYVVLEFKGKERIKFNVIMHEDDVRDFMKQLESEMPERHSL